MELGRHQVIRGDCIEVMRGMEPDSVDAIVTDPPYGLEFMNKDWDRPWSGRGEKPAGAGMSKGGFKSNNGYSNRQTPAYGKAWTNKRCTKCGHIQSGGSPCRCPEPDWEWERGDTAAPMRGFQEWCTEWATEALRVAKPGAYLLAAGSPRTYHRLACAIEDAGWVLIDCIQHLHGQGFPKGKGQLKPAYEPWTLARKPAPRVLPLQIDACRIEGVPPSVPQPKFNAATDHVYDFQTGKGRNGAMSHASGRWPANIILSESAAQGLDEIVGERKVGGGTYERAPDGDGRTAYGRFTGATTVSYGDSGGPSRFFYTPKASRPERGEGNIHPTVKPLALMRWLCKLAVPPGGICLDPFGGSGTTLLACEQEGFASILIERETEYVDIIIRRYEQMTKQPALPEVG